MATLVRLTFMPEHFYLPDVVVEDIPVDKVADLIKDEELIEHLITQSSIIRDEADQIRTRANALIDTLRKSRQYIGRSVNKNDN